MTGRRAGYGSALAVVAVTFLAYLPALRNDFINWEDYRYVVENAHIRGIGPDLFAWAFLKSQAIMWHPLTWLSHALDYAVWGANPLGHHLTNVVLHCANTFLVCLLVPSLWSLSNAGAGTPGAAKITAALITGLLFGLHPLHVESVAWVAERKDVLYSLFYLLALLAYAGYLRAGKPAAGGVSAASPNRRYLAALGLFALAVLSKPMAVTLPLLLLVLDWYEGRLGARERRGMALLEKVPFVVLSLPTILLTVGPPTLRDALGAGEHSTVTRVLVSVRSLAFYLEKMLWPGDLFPHYLYPDDASLSSPRYLVPAIVVTALTAASLACVKRCRVLPAVWAAYVATLLPVLGFVQVGFHAMADRYAYLASVGPFLLVGLAGARVVRKGAPAGRAVGAGALALVGAGAVVCALLAVQTVRQLAIWKDSPTFWRYVIEKEPRAFVAYNNLAIILAARGEVDAAIAHYRTALEIRPDAAETHHNLALILPRRGQVDEAITHYRRTLELRPHAAETRNNLALLLAGRGRTDEAIAHLRKALEVAPGYAEAHGNLASILADRGQADESIAHYRTALDLARQQGKQALAEGLRIRIAIIEAGRQPRR